MKDLELRFTPLGLTLVKIGDEIFHQTDPTDDITIYKISLAVVGSVLGTLVLFLTVIYFMKTKR